VAFHKNTIFEELPKEDLDGTFCYASLMDPGRVLQKRYARFPLIFREVEQR
jgi:hypothetical protein